MRPEIILTKKVNLKDYILIEGFPGIGLVGTIAAGYIVEKRNMEPIGYITSDKFPPMTTIHAGKPYFPARIYRDRKGDFCVLFAEFVVPANSVHDLSELILNFAKQKGIKQIVSLAGMSSQKEASPDIFGIASNEEMANYLKVKKIKLIQEGVTTGVSGVLLAKCASQDFPAFSLLAESKGGYPDPRASAILLSKLDSLIGLKVDTKALLEEAGVIETKMKKMIDQIKKEGGVYQKVSEDYPSMYE
jgi:uncharacterized protein